MLQKISITSVLILSLFFTLSAQESKVPLSLDRYQKNIYAEFLGSNVIIGANFDMRLNKGRNDGIGFKIGVGGKYYVPGEPRYGILIVLPLEFNHIVGKKSHGFVTGIGMLPAFVTKGEESLAIGGGYLTIGYRYQSISNGAVFKIHWNPLFLRGSEGTLLGWFGIGLGYGFR